MNAVTCATWLKQGTLLSNPKKHVSNNKSLQSISKRKKYDQSTDNDKEEINKISQDYDLDDYSSDDEASCLKSLATYSDNTKDPYMRGFVKENNDSSSEDEVIESSDSVIIVGKTHREYHSLEVWVVSKDEDKHLNSYCHHDYILTDCPLAVECFSNTDVNFAAIGSLSSVIQLWDLDLLNVVEPMIVLGDSKQEGHTDAIISLSHKYLSQKSCLLLSGSADGTIALWSINENGANYVKRSTLGHSDKIQAVQWHTVEDSIFGTGSFDGLVRVYDCRADCFKTKKSDCEWTVDGEVEKIMWDTTNPFNLFATTSTGLVHYFDIRMKEPIWLLNAHTPASVSGIAQSKSSDGGFLTTSDEGKVKIWDSRLNPVELISTKSYKIGSIFCVTSSPDDPMLFCVGGEREMKIVDLKKDTKINQYFLEKKSQGACPNPKSTLSAFNTDKNVINLKNLKKLEDCVSNNYIKQNNKQNSFEENILSMQESTIYDSTKSHKRKNKNKKQISSELLRNTSECSSTSNDNSNVNSLLNEGKLSLESTVVNKKKKKKKIHA